jgi:hypothetical protein
VAKSSKKRTKAAPENGGETRPAKGGGKGSAKEKERERDGSSGHSAPAGNTRVNLALPFSKIEVQEPTAELVEVATLLSELVGALAEWVPEETLGEIRSRAEALCARLSP